MKDIRPALRTYLLADATVSGLVNGVRIHYGRLPQGQVDPSVVFNKVTEIGDYHMQGDSGLGLLRLQFDSWAQSTDVATQLSNAVYDRLTGAKGDMSGINVHGTFLVAGFDDYDGMMQMYRASRDYLVWYGASQ